MPIIKLQGVQERERGIYYEVDSECAPIGEGGMGKVYKGKSVDAKSGLTRPVAIKFMFMESPEQSIARARREASIRLRNDNLIEMLGFIETDEVREDKIVKHYHVVSELLNGVTLADLLEGKTCNPRGEEISYAVKLLNDFTKDPDHFAWEVTRSVISGLMALHDAGYIHRDIDPSNIMITDDGHIKLIDFGICKQINKLTTNDKSLTNAGVFIGKPEYASPELVLGDLKNQGYTTDIYAVGIMMYQCIMGHVPFQGTRYQILDKQINEKIPAKNIKNKGLRQIIQKACEKDQNKRYQTSAEMRVALDEWERNPNPGFSIDKKFIYVGLGSLAVLAVVFLLFMLNPHSTSSDPESFTVDFDSLKSTIDLQIDEAEKLTNKGLEHGEYYDTLLVNAKILFNEVDKNVELIMRADSTIMIQDYYGKKKVLDDALDSACEELAEKAEILEEDTDPEVRKMAMVVKNRVENIKKARNK